jgi:hypothetical protein
MVIAVVSMRMMELPIHEIVRVVSMRHGFVTAPRAVTVSLLVPVAEPRRARRGVAPIHLEPMFVNVVLVLVV